MLPFGHVAAGYLVAQAVLKIGNPALDPVQLKHLLYWGMFFGFAPDLDMFIAFALARSFSFGRKPELNHRSFSSHAPVVWLAAGLVVIGAAEVGIFGSLGRGSPTSGSAGIGSPVEFYKYFGLLLWLGSWSHFFLDSIQYGIKWLWPFSQEVFAFKDKLIKDTNNETSSVRYWLHWLKFYFQRLKLTLYLEVVIILAAVAVYRLN